MNVGTLPERRTDAEYGRMAFILLIGLTVVYVSLYFYWRSGIRMRLEEDWVLEGRPGDRDTTGSTRDSRRAPGASGVFWFFSSMSYRSPRCRCMST
jgi:hypothetical protein